MFSIRLPRTCFGILALLIPVLVFGLASSSIADETAKDDTAASVASFKTFLDPFVKEFMVVMKSKPENVMDLSIDVKKTDSLISPVIGVFSFKWHAIKDNPIYEEYVLTFSRDGEKWVPAKIQIFQDIFGEKKPLQEDEPAMVQRSEFVRKAADAAQKKK